MVTYWDIKVISILKNKKACSLDARIHEVSQA